MSALFVIPAGFQQFGTETAEQLANQLLDGHAGAAQGGAVILHPQSIRIGSAPGAETVAYDGSIGLERNQATWRPLAGRRFDDIFVFGLDRAVDFEEIILACYLDGARRTFFDRTGMHDMATWHDQVRPDLRPRPVHLRQLGPDRLRDYLRRIHRSVAEGLATIDFDPPSAVIERSPEHSQYVVPRLAVDLAQQTIDLQRELHDESFSILMCREGSLVHSSDFYRAIANFVTAIDGIDSVLDVGCGSGFLASHLAASGRYKDVLGVDSSPQRIDGARLFASLNAAPARFDVMSMAALRLPDRAVDLTVTSFALEQTGQHLERCLDEIRRVTRKLIVLFEPTTEFTPTLGSLWHLPRSGWANQYQRTLATWGVAYATRPNLLYHYFNPGTVFVIDLEQREHPACRYPALFQPAWDAWPGGVAFV